MKGEEHSRKRMLSCCERLVRALLGVDIRCCLFAVVLTSLTLFLGLGVFMTANAHRDSQEDMEALHVNRNVMAVQINESKVPPTESTN